MKTRTLHYFSGLFITVFVGFHLFNHICSIYGAEMHIEVMNYFRKIYRNPVVETLLLAAVLVQIVSGLRLFRKTRNLGRTFFEKLHLRTGLYLAFFLIIHVAAVLSGRLFLHLDTNFYFGIAGLNTFPFSLFFIPYYALAIISFFGHVAAVHSKKMRVSILSISPHKQAMVILGAGVVITVLIFYGLTNHFRGVIIPVAYQILTSH